MAVIAYMRVSTHEQEDDGQRQTILEWAAKTGTKIDEWVSEKISSRVRTEDRKVSELVARLESGDTLVTAEVSRLGRSMTEVFSLIKAIRDRAATTVLAGEGRTLGAEETIEANAYLFAISIGAQIERQMISQRTKAALAARKASGVKLGRPKGPGKSKLDPHRETIVDLLSYGVPKAVIARRLGVATTTFDVFVQKRGLDREAAARAEAGAG